MSWQCLRVKIDASTIYHYTFFGTQVLMTEVYARYSTHTHTPTAKQRTNFVYIYVLKMRATRKCVISVYPRKENKRNNLIFEKARPNINLSVQCH